MLLHGLLSLQVKDLFSIVVNNVSPTVSLPLFKEFVLRVP